ncbi:hypothetical protein [Nonomuraea sp. NPDC023979]|uniref:hypothetical protein n=1 Tax=Nonomuraea sp. NPDC023979 TaxID=3154796 RepID=UPI0033DF2BBC
MSALVISGCADDVTADCVAAKPDGSGAYQIVDDRYCEGGSHASYVWYYGGTARHGSVRGGTTVRPGSGEITTRTGKVISRGGFGGRSSGGGG